MPPTALPSFRSAATSSWLVAAALAASLFGSLPIAHADDYETCMVGCKAEGGSSRGCHQECE